MYTIITSIKLPLFLAGISIAIITSNLNIDNEQKKSLPGQVVNNFSVAELLSTKKDNLMPAEYSMLTVIQKSTFENGAALIQIASKKDYSELFPKDYSRFICWELTLQAKTKSFNRDLNLKFKLSKDNGKQLAARKVDSWIPAGSKKSTHNACWGWPYRDFWETGEYTFQIFPQKDSSDTDSSRLLAAIHFEVK